jgi:hypothetical protein
LNQPDTPKQGHTMTTKADVVAKFNQLHKKYYNSKGYMVSTVPDEITKETETFTGAAWREVYNRYASDRVNIRSTNATVPFMGHEFKMEFHRPLVQDHRYEFEEYFGFGGHCSGFNINRTIACFPKKFDETINIDAILQSGADSVDTEYAKQAITLLALGGYVKFWDAVHEFEKWFVDVAGIPECKDFSESKQLMSRIFEVMQLESSIL